MSHRQSVKTVPCPTCKAEAGKPCLFKFVQNSGTFHRTRLEAYRETPRYKENVRKSLMRINITPPKKKKKSKENGKGRRSYEVSGACKAGRHTACWNRYCPCPCGHHSSY